MTIEPSPEAKVVESILRASADSLEVSRDLRHRVLDRAYWGRRADSAWWKLLLVYTAVSLILNVAILLANSWKPVGHSNSPISTWARRLALSPAQPDTPAQVLTSSGPKTAAEAAATNGVSTGRRRDRPLLRGAFFSR